VHNQQIEEATHFHESTKTKQLNTVNIYRKLECGPMPNVMAALPNIGGACCSTPQSFADAQN